MKSNIHKAVLLSATLSLLLGLSLGQIHSQHKKIQQLEGRLFNEHSIIWMDQHHPDEYQFHINCWPDHNRQIRLQNSYERFNYDYRETKSQLKKLIIIKER